MTFTFVGNRCFVLEEMFKLGLNIVKIFAIKGSYLEKELKSRNLNFISIASKSELIKEINNTPFNIMISNGCPHILPISDLKKDGKEFINIHPSFLPDLRGADPQVGALLYGKDAGATCHIMDDKIDNGDIVSQIKIPYSKDLDAALLYQLSFMAEKEVFIDAFNKNFKPIKKQEKSGSEIYYTKKDDDLKIDFSKTALEIYQKIKAFSNKSQGAYFIFENDTYKVFDCEIVSNEYLLSKLNDYQDGEVVINYENHLLIKKNDCYLKLRNFDQEVSLIKNGTILKD
ncbi:MAG: formyltransferase family protein [Alphaproteobacteria bacterium]